MNKLMMSVSLLLLTSAVLHAQTIPNAGFEIWSAFGGPIESPVEWSTGPSASKSTDMHSGTYALQLKTDTFTNPMTSLLDTIPGRAFTGTQGMGPGSQGVPGYAFTTRPDSLTAWCKYSPVGADTFVIRVLLTKWNSVSGSADIISDSHYLGQPSSVYQRISFPIMYLSPNLPDSATIEIMSSSSNPQSPIIGSELLIDDLTFVTNIPAALYDISGPSALSIQCFPNPANDRLTINHVEAGQLSIVDINGKIMTTIQVPASRHLVLSTSSFANGLYFIQQKNRNNVAFSVQH